MVDASHKTWIFEYGETEEATRLVFVEFYYSLYLKTNLTLENVPLQCSWVYSQDQTSFPSPAARGAEDAQRLVGGV